jgi:LacI family transcriptional regulator
VTAAGLSRRVVEKRFRKAVGRSVLTEIRRARVEEVSRMLTETNQSISEIADVLGFAGVEHIARYFRQVKGTTPRAYRKQFGQA